MRALLPKLRAAALFSLALVPAALLLAPSEAAACSCMPSPGAVEAAQAVDVVFHGKLLSVVKAPGNSQYAIPSKVFTFEVVGTFKGQLDGQVRLNTADNSAACGREFGTPASEWLIYARIDADTGELHDNLCSRTMSFDKAAADVAELEANAGILDQAPPKPEPEPEQPGPADPEPKPISPPSPSDAAPAAPEPTAKPQRCAVTDSPVGGFTGLLGLGLGLGLGVVRRRLWQ